VNNPIFEMTDLIKGFKIFVFLFTFSFVGFANESPFRVTSFEEAEKIAKKENKPLLVDFYAAWCGPCKWMDETTFSDDKIRKILKEDYISIKVNIDDFDGYELKSKYEVRYLPTIIIFKNGRVVERLEETVGVIKMNNLLNQHTSSTTAVAKKVAPNTNPKDKAVAANFTENLTLDEINSNFNSLNHVYKLQLGVFAKKDGATKLVNELSTKVFEQPLIIQDYRNNTIIYKVILGEFHSLNDAEQFKSQLSSDHKVESFILRM
jgi:thioredoxin 1